MKKISIFIIALMLVIGISVSANATLYNRGGGLIYDDVLKVTWLQDANYAKTSGYNADGLMTWSEATTWAANLSYYDSVRNVTWTDWRLPQTLPVNGTSYGYDYAVNGSTDEGYNISAFGSSYPGSIGSEMAYLFYNSLDNKGYYSVTGDPQAGWGLQKVGPFQNIQTGLVSGHTFDAVYWSGTEVPINTDNAWYFDFKYGYQNHFNDKDNLDFSWAVRDGDVGPAPAPEPTTILLLGFGLMGLAGLRRKFK